MLVSHLLVFAFCFGFMVGQQAIAVVEAGTGSELAVLLSSRPR